MIKQNGVKNLMAFIGIAMLIGGQIMPLTAMASMMPREKKEVRVGAPTATPRATLLSPDRYRFKTVKGTVTAYSSTPDQTDDTPFHTAIGSHVRHGIVAANWLPIGTMVRFPDFNPDVWYVVEDRMNERYTDRTDIWMESREAAKKFGKKQLTIEVAMPIAETEYALR